MLAAAHDAWDDAVGLAEIYGVRNSQATVLAPTGCLVGGTLVPTERGLVRLRSLGDPDGEQWQDLGIDVATDVGARTATKFYVNGLEPVVTVATARGYRIQGTPQHRVKVVDEASGAWAWKRLPTSAPATSCRSPSASWSASPSRWPCRRCRRRTGRASTTSTSPAP